MDGDQPTEPRTGDRAAATTAPGADDDAAGKKAREVCAASAAFASCTHRRRRSSPRSRPPHHDFVDWYLVLAIGEAASEDVIRRRYRQLALQLHPDKNSHPKAEVAFKVVSEAYACLTDKARRRAFDAERRASFCAACHDRHVLSSPQSTPGVTGHRAVASDKRTARAGATAQSAKARGGARRPPASSPAQALRDVQNRMRDECRVIDTCLRANNAAACARRRQSFPLFDPSDPCSFPDYPHTRPPPLGAVLRRFEEHLDGGDQNKNHNQRWCRSGGESPVYQIRTSPPERAATGTHRSFPGEFRF